MEPKLTATNIKIANTKGAYSAYRKTPHMRDQALYYAAYVAKRDNKVAYVSTGNSYMVSIFVVGFEACNNTMNKTLFAVSPEGEVSKVNWDNNNE